MQKSNFTKTNTRKGRHNVFFLRIHLVVRTKAQNVKFTKIVLGEFEIIAKRVCMQFDGKLIYFHGGNDYIRLIIDYPPTIAVADMVSNFKGVLSRMIRKSEHPSVEEAIIDGQLWEAGYFVASTDGTDNGIYWEIEKFLTKE